MTRPDPGAVATLLARAAHEWLASRTEPVQVDGETITVLPAEEAAKRGLDPDEVLIVCRDSDGCWFEAEFLAATAYPARDETEAAVTA